ncbi:CesT family type III secretion system chaperone [Pseudomonas psychrophila]|uniref:CesT family type III secretion system chaperone n=1 Tax=Pseudomonas psychrophila TaxID=122355 RepID=UPI0002F2E579|nr:CesT family type III secretion system chaperone [Pseudomonas psychrophila]
MPSRLKQILLPVFRAMNLDTRRLDDSTSYVMTLHDDLRVEFSESPSDFLTVSCLLPISAERFDDPYTLGILLQTNVLGLEHPPILTGAIVEQKKVILWARQPFVMLDSTALQRLFERYIEQAQKMRDWLASPLQAPAKRTDSRLPR